MTNHISWETLNDLVDDVLSPAEAITVESHARECPSCARTIAELRSMVAGVREMPRTVTPPAEIWTSIRDTIESKKVAHLPVGAGTRQTRGWWVTPGSLSAAAVVLIAVTATITGVLVSPRQAPAIAGAMPRAVTVAASWQASERAFQEGVLELRTQLEGSYDRLAPATLAKVEKALATIDLAIAEGRAALLQDPSNAALSELLASNYRQKIELLRRTTQLAGA